MDLHYSQTFGIVISICFMFESPMDLHYSQTHKQKKDWKNGLNPLWIYTTLKPFHKNGQERKRLNPLWIYTTLKQYKYSSLNVFSLNPLWIYTTLKRLVSVIT